MGGARFLDWLNSARTSMKKIGPRFFDPKVIPGFTHLLKALRVCLKKDDFQERLHKNLSAADRRLQPVCRNCSKAS